MSDDARAELMALKKDELIAKADEVNVDSEGTKAEIVDRLLEREEKFTSPDADADADEPDAEPVDSTNPTGEYEIDEETDYHAFAAKVGYSRGGRQLAALNGVRNGRLELHPGDKVVVP